MSFCSCLPNVQRYSELATSGEARDEQYSENRDEKIELPCVTIGCNAEENNTTKYTALITLRDGC